MSDRYRMKMLPSHSPRVISPIQEGSCRIRLLSTESSIASLTGSARKSASAHKSNVQLLRFKFSLQLTQKEFFDIIAFHLRFTDKNFFQG